MLFFTEEHLVVCTKRARVLADPRYAGETVELIELARLNLVAGGYAAAFLGPSTGGALDMVVMCSRRVHTCASKVWDGGSYQGAREMCDELLAKAMMG